MQMLADRMERYRSTVEDLQHDSPQWAHDLKERMEEHKVSNWRLQALPTTSAGWGQQLRGLQAVPCRRLISVKVGDIRWKSGQAGGRQQSYDHDTTHLAVHEGSAEALVDSSMHRRYAST